MLDTLIITLFLFGVFLFTLSLCIQLIYKLLRNFTIDIGLQTRIIILWTLSISPIILAIILILNIVYDASYGYLNITLDHCLVHSDNHFHLCFLHNNVENLSITSILICLIPVIFLIPTFKLLSNIKNSNNRKVVMEQLSKWDERGFFLLPAKVMIAFNIGFFKSTNFISSTLLEKLNPTEIEMILKHENTHKLYYDNCSKIIFEFLWLCYPFRNVIKEDFYELIEVRADISIIESNHSWGSIRRLFENIVTNNESKDKLNYASYFDSQDLNLRLENLKDVNLNSKYSFIAPFILSTILFYLIPNLISPNHHWLENYIHNLFF